MTKWYEEESSAIVTVEQGRIFVKSSVAGYIKAALKLQKQKQEVLKYIKHTKKRQIMQRKLNRLAEIIDIMIHYRVDIFEARQWLIDGRHKGGVK